VLTFRSATALADLKVGTTTSTSLLVAYFAPTRSFDAIAHSVITVK